MWVSSFHSRVLSSPRTSLCHPLCATMQDFKRCKWRQYAPETCKIHCILADSSRQKRWGRAMLQKATPLPHIFPLVLSAGFLKRRSLYFVTKQSDQLPPTNKACRVWQLFLPVEKIPGPITVETPQFFGFVVLQHRLGVVSVEDCVQPSSEIVYVWSCSFSWFLLVPWFSISFDKSFWWCSSGYALQRCFALCQLPMLFLPTETSVLASSFHSSSILATQSLGKYPLPSSDPLPLCLQWLKHMH